MIKLAAMSLYIVVGVVIGGLFYRTYGPDKLTLPLCLLLGVLGAFAGLWIADLADIHLIGNVIDSLIFSSVGSALLLALNLLVRNRNKNV